MFGPHPSVVRYIRVSNGSNEVPLKSGHWNRLNPLRHKGFKVLVPMVPMISYKVYREQIEVVGEVGKCL